MAATIALRASGEAALSGDKERDYTSDVTSTATTPVSHADQLPADQEVIARSLAGDRYALSLLIGRYSDPLYRHALASTGSPDVAEDSLQSSFIKAYQHLAGLHGRI